MISSAAELDAVRPCPVIGAADGVGWPDTRRRASLASEVVDDDFRWLTKDEELAWIALIGVIMQLPNALDAQLQRDSGLTFYEYGVLVALTHAPGPNGLRMSELAVITSGQMSRLSQVITRMEKRGAVKRHPDPDDGRATRVVVTDAGRDLLESAAPGHVTTVRSLVFDHLSPTQVRNLRTIARSIADALGPPNPLMDIRKEQLGDRPES